MNNVTTRFLLLINSLLLFTISLSAAPMIKVDSVDFDMGTIKEGEQKSIKHAFIVKNTGKDTLIIKQVKPSCGCTAVGYDSIIPPGGEGKMTAEINISHAPSGTLRKYVTITSNADNNPVFKVSLGCTIRPELSIEPAYLSLQPDQNGKAQQKLSVTTQKKDLKIQEVFFKENEKSDSKGADWKATLPMQFAFELAKTDTVLPDGYMVYNLNISLTLAEDKTTYGNFTIKTNHPKKKEVTFTGVILERRK